MKVYHQNSQLKQQGAFLEGKKNGNWTAWDENGRKVREALFLKGSLISETNFEDSTEDNEAKPAPQGSDG